MQSKDTLPEIRKTIVLKVPIEKAWEAIATSEGLAGWWMDNTFVPEVGRDFILHAGHFGDSPCKVTAIEPPHRVEFDWGQDWHISLQLKALEDGTTEFTLIHSGWDADKVTEFGQPHSVIRGIMDGGWEGIVKDNLPAYIEA